MKMRTLISKLVLSPNDAVLKKKENASNPRKLKKSERRERSQPKGCAEFKKPLSRVQQNRFTNIHELSSLSSSFVQLQDMFGTLLLDFSKDPVQMKISDATGNYELNVSKESLSEFKMKILLGQNPKCKPTFSIFLGECQCYPELPEGTLELKENDGTGSQIDSIGEGSEIEAEIDTVRAAQDTLRAPDDALKNDTFENDLSASLLALFGDGEMDQIKTAHNDENIVSYETRHLRIDESQKLELKANSDEIVVKVRPNKRGGSKLRKVRPSEKQPDGAARRYLKKHSTYRNNLEGFVKFLMNDRVCGSLLGKMKSFGNTVEVGKRGEQKIVNYSDGQEYRIVFSPDKKSKKMTHTKTADGERPLHSAEADGSLKNDKEATADGIQVLFERTKFEKAAFVEQVKKEIEEWKARDEKTVNVEIVDDANSSSSSADAGSDDSNVVTVYEDMKTSKKLDTELDDATSNNCWTEAVKVESTEFFLDLKEKENPQNREKESFGKVNEDEEFGRKKIFEEEEEFLAWMKSDPIHERREDEKYVAPISLGTTSTADIEAMWLTFVEMFHHSSQLTKKIYEPHPHNVSSSSSTEPIKVTLTGEEVPKRNVDTTGTYPGQHSLPFFVEESLRRVNSMLGKRHYYPILHPASGRKPEEIICQPRIHHRFKRDFTQNNIFFSPKNYKPQTNRSQSFHHPDKFSVKRSRIFFNPHATIGDWYQ